MAITNKAAIQALIDAYTANITLYITSNNNKEITGSQLKQILDESSVILEDLKDSYFNLLDEPRTALSVNYANVGNPLNWNGGTAPATQNVVNDQLAQRLTDFETNNASQNIAYVATTGSDTIGENELGNPLKPFATFSAALSALPNSNAKIVALGGSYTENINLGAKSNFVLDIRGCNITGTGGGAALRTNGGATSNMVILAEGANISTSSGYVLELNAINGLVVGGIWTATSSNICVITTNQNRIVGSTFRNTSTGKCADTLNNGQFINCIFKSNTDTTINRTNNSVFIACIIENSIVSNFAILTSATLSLFIDCGIKGRVSCGVGADFKGRFQGCKIEASGKAIGMQGDAQPFFYNCTISGTEDCIDMTLVTGASTSQSQFVDCKLFAGTGAIFLEPIYLVSGKKIYSVNNVYNKVFVPSVTAEQRVFEFNKTQITDFVVPPSITIT